MRKAPWTSFAAVRGPQRRPRQNRIRKKSVRQARLDLQYTKLRRIWIQRPENQRCAVCVRKFYTGKIKQHEIKPTEQVHHSRGRGKFYLAMETWVPVCFEHHDWITRNPKEATAEGWNKSRLAKTQ